MATIAETRVKVYDGGPGVVVEAEITVQVSSTESLVHKIAQADLGLTPTQITNLQNAMNAIRTRAINVTKADFTIP